MAVALKAAAGATATIKIFSGAVPANCEAADPSGTLASGSLPADPFAETDGVLSKAGTWTLTGSADGTAASFRIYDSSPDCLFQGNVTATGGGGVCELSSTTIAIGQATTVTSVTITVGGA